MKSVTNKEIIRSLYEDVLSKRKFELLPALIAPGFSGPGGSGVDGFIAPVMGVVKSFPDVTWTVLELIGEDSKVAVRYRLEGTHREKFQNILPTGKRIVSEGFAIFHLENGKIIRNVLITDRLGFLQQLEVVPVDLTSLQLKASAKEPVYFIDKFSVPRQSKPEFYERMTHSRNVIRQLPGFIEDSVYEYLDSNGTLVCITIAQWASRDDLAKAKELVQAEYKKEGFDPAEMMTRLGIKADRGIYVGVE